MSDRAFLEELGPYLSGVTAMSGAQVHHYAPGGSTAKTAWTGYDKSATASQPIDADAQGVVNMWGDGLYHLVVVDSAAAVIEDLDNVQFGPVQPVAFAARKSGVDQTGVATGVTTLITFPDTIFDPMSTFSSSRWTPGRVGRALVTARFNMSSVGSGSGAFICNRFFVNSAQSFLVCQHAKPTQSGAFSIELTALVDITSITDFVEVYGSQNGGADATVVGDVISHTWFMGAMIS